MLNHNHLIVVPRDHNSLADTLLPLNLSYSQYLHRKLKTVGQNWQGRYFSAPMDAKYTSRAFQYLALNPVKAGYVTDFEQYPWSSAGDLLVNRSNKFLSADDQVLQAGHEALVSLKASEQISAQEFLLIKRNTLQNIPVGEESFVKQIELEVGRPLRWRKPGRPKKLHTKTMGTLPIYFALLAVSLRSAILNDPKLDPASVLMR